jgi:hypothetical protein
MIGEDLVNRDAILDTFAAELTLAAYGVVLRTRTGGTWVDLELALWRALADTVKAWPPHHLRKVIPATAVPE